MLLLVKILSVGTDVLAKTAFINDAGAYSLLGTKRLQVGLAGLADTYSFYTSNPHYSLEVNGGEILGAGKERCRLAYS